MADRNMMLTVDEYMSLRKLLDSSKESEGATLALDGPEPRKKKISKYNRELGRQIKKLKVAHPRTAVPKLMKRAHRATKKKLKM
tara:strand:+ start:349 stop:600 length:252 start_codon:yes stop_codon:yes gene_type:complete